MVATRGGRNTSDRRIDLSDNFQFKLFATAMNTVNRHQRDLNTYDYGFYRKLRDGWDLAGRELTVTVKQLNHLKGIADELEAGRYDRKG